MDLARARNAAGAAAIVLLALLCAGCSWFGGGKSGTKTESVFSVRPGQCFQAPTSVQASA